jgi:apolipoprotein D and lipocalin family protein
MLKIKLFFTIAMALCGMSSVYAENVTPIADFEIKSYLGTWYEIARLPNRFEKKCIAPITANYSIDPNNANKVIVVNKCSRNGDGPSIAEGAASFVESANVGKLEVTFLPKYLRWLPIGYGDYWVLYVDYEKIALVGSPDHDYLWVLARSDNVDKESMIKVLAIAKNQGFETDKLIFNYESAHYESITPTQ